MERTFEFTLYDEHGPETQARVDALFHGENLLQMILHAHILVEQALTARIEEKLAAPEFFKLSEWNFYRKAILYLCLYAPGKATKEMLLGFNTLRNRIAHKFQDDLEACVTQSLPFETVYPAWAIGNRGRPDGYHQVSTMALNLLCDLGTIRGVRRNDV
jgi:hypothetical protein